MKLLAYKTLWGQADTNDPDSLIAACERAVQDGFDGIEGQIPADPAVAETLAATLRSRRLDYIAEICTAGSYVPDRQASVDTHLRDLDAQLSRLDPLIPRLVNCIGGCDRWPLVDSQRFFRGALDVADRHGVALAFETHRGRSLYSPWVTERVLRTMDLPLTCDFSHWCVVAEGLYDTEEPLLAMVARHARHIHGRVGHDQGPQVSDPRSPFYRRDLERHLRWWRRIWAAQRAEGQRFTTFTPEFGPDGYQAIDAATGEPIGDLDADNRWMAERARAEFREFAAEFGGEGLNTSQEEETP